MRMALLLVVAGSFVAAPAMALEGQVRKSGTPMDTPARIASENDAGDRAPELIRGNAPVYPVSEVVSGTSGTSVLVFTVGTDGKPKDAIIERADSERFAAHALLALQDWRFKPAIENGTPVEARLRQRFDYRTP